MSLGASRVGLMGASGGVFEATGGTVTTYTDGGVDYKVHTLLIVEHLR